MDVIGAHLSAGAATLLWILAAIAVIAGIVAIVRGAIIYGIVLIIIGCLIGPGGISIWR
ncbi:MAG TPA: GPGG-motif small membrane protein [Actinomycetota bacterium]